MRKLKQRTYLGEGFVHQFRHNETDEVLLVPCTKQEYVRLGEINGKDYNPTLPNYTWECSLGGIIKVDTPNSVLNEDEYCIVGNEAVVILSGLPFRDRMKTIPAKNIINDEIDDSLWLQ